MSVRHDWRDRGIGTALLQALMTWAEEHPLIEKVELSVFADNERAIHLYQKLGFLEEARRLRAFKLGPGQYVDEILLYRFAKPMS